MKTKMLLITTIITVLLLPTVLRCGTTEEVLGKLSRERYFPYQDIIINNKVLSRGVGPDCPSRYAAISKVIGKYNRPIKVLDIGASNGYFSLRIAYDYKALCVMADVSDRLKDICTLNDKVPNIVYFKKAMSLDDLKKLVKEEHFDVVLALNVVHHMEPWKDILDCIFELGDTVIIETPPSNDDRVKDTPSIPHIENYLLNRPEGHIIAQTARAAANNFDQITVLDGNSDVLKQKQCTPGAFAKMFCFQKMNSPLSKGINLKVSTFNMFNGVYPERSTIKDSTIIIDNK